MSEIKNYAEYLAEEARCDTAAVHDFIASYQGGSEIHVFVEGEEDISFYLPEIRRVSGNRKIFSYNCGGKWNVVRARDYIEKFYSSTVLFFIDRDYDDFLGKQARKSDCLYVTDGYSIENWMASDEAMTILLEDLLAIPSGEANTIKLRAKEIQSRVIPRMYLLAAWILAAKDASCDPNLNNTNSMSSLLTISSTGFIEFGHSEFREFKRKVDAGKGFPSIKSQIGWYRAARGYEFHEICRGKYHARIFCKSICRALAEENERRRQKKQRQIRIPDALQGARVIELLAARVPYAHSVAKFIRDHLD